MIIEKRFDTTERASIQVIGQIGLVTANLKNLSKSGACIEWESEGAVLLRKGDLVSLTVSLMALGKRYNMSAEVIWRRGNRSGLHFISTEKVMNKMLTK